MNKSNPVEKHFLLIILLISISALWKPPVFLWIRPHIPKFLGIIMFGMGITLTFSDFLDIWHRRSLVLIGIAAQYTIMPILAVLLHNVSGLSVGYGMGKLFRTSEENTRTLAFEIGMQNSGLGVSLATQFFSTMAALPGAVFSLLHNMTGIVMAKWWALHKTGEEKNE